MKDHTYYTLNPPRKKSKFKLIYIKVYNFRKSTKPKPKPLFFLSPLPLIKISRSPLKFTSIERQLPNINIPEQEKLHSLS